MVDFNKMGYRRVSDVSATDVDLSDKEHCILCFNDMKYFALGKCNHKNVCHTCILRLRCIIKDKKCPICKTECEELCIAETPILTFEEF
jgi:Zinc finger, C3HC4 type (RING finger)